MPDCAEKTLRKICLFFEDCKVKPPAADALLSDQGISSLWEQLRFQLSEEGLMGGLEVSDIVLNLFDGDVDGDEVSATAVEAASAAGAGGGGSGGGGRAGGGCTGIDILTQLLKDFIWAFVISFAYFPIYLIPILMTICLMLSIILMCMFLLLQVNCVECAL